MKNLQDYLIESNDKSENELNDPIKFKIWKRPDKIVTKLDDDEDYQKIDYEYSNKEKGIKMEFLIGRKSNKWYLWTGKVGAVSYDDDPYKDLKTDKFYIAINKAVEYARELINEVIDNPTDWVQYYIHR